MKRGQPWRMAAVFAGMMGTLWIARALGPEVVRYLRIKAM